MNIKTLFLVCMFCCSAVFCNAQSEESFLRGNQLYEHGDYRTALATYDGINNKSFRVWYNMGNCAYRLDDFAQARLFWERARMGAPSRFIDQIDQNLQLIDKKFETSCSKGLFTDFLQTIPWFWLQILFLLSWFCLFFVLQRFGLRTILFVFLVLLTSGLGMLVAMKYSTRSVQRVVVMQPDVMMYSGPDKNYQVAGVLKKTNVLRVKSSREGWYRVACESIDGWVPADQVAVI